MPEDDRRPPRRANQLTWVNYRDPQIERKSKANKAVVRKAAKLSTLTPAAGAQDRAAPIAPASFSLPSSLPWAAADDHPSKGQMQNQSREISFAQAVPSPLLRSGNSDPFDSLPIETTSLHFFLLNRYCESAHLKPTCRNSCPKVQGLRRTYLIPTLMHSAGTLHVARKQISLSLDASCSQLVNSHAY
jgi:hypothetical protein